jgi:LmbE family N-acetylglucosaminyl deacetylase
MRRAGLILIFMASWSWAADSLVPTLTLSPDDRVLVLAPHPDDDILGCAGVLQQASSMKLPIRVVYLTNGDNYEWAFWAYKKRPVLLPKEMIQMGMRRTQEATHAQALWGVKPDQLTFLGYPDWGTEKIFTEYWQDNQLPFRSMLTKVTQVPYPNAFQPGAPYFATSVLANLKQVIGDYKPTKIFVAHPADGHRDHRTLYLFMQVALWELGDQAKPDVYAYLVHYPGWPSPRGLRPNRSIEPPSRWVASRWIRFPLSPEAADMKARALREHKTQMALDRNYLNSFVGQNELFEQVADLRLGQLIEASSPSPTPSDESEIVWKSLYKEGNDIVLRLELKGPTAFQKSIQVYAFGFRHDSPFAEMPKIRMVFHRSHLSIFDQNTKAIDSGIQVRRDGRLFLLRVPLKALGDPEKILGTAWSKSAEKPYDWRAWRVVDLEISKGS